jgi:hypothetical protein
MEIENSRVEPRMKTSHSAGLNIVTGQWFKVDVRSLYTDVVITDIWIK